MLIFTKSIQAFEYFGTIPQTVKIDNLKAGVITPNFYEPTIETQYADFYNTTVLHQSRQEFAEDKIRVK